MEECQSLYEKKVDAMMCKMFGDGDSQLKAITKLMTMTLDASGNVVPIKELSRVQYHDN